MDGTRTLPLIGGYFTIMVDMVNSQQTIGRCNSIHRCFPMKISQLSFDDIFHCRKHRQGEPLQVLRTTFVTKANVDLKSITWISSTDIASSRPPH